MTRKGCLLPSLALWEQEHHSPPATAVSDEPQPQESPVSEASPDGCVPIWVWELGSSVANVYLVKRKVAKSALPPPAPRMEPVPAPDPEVNLVKRKSPKSGLPPPAPRTEPAPAPDPDPEVYLVKKEKPCLPRMLAKRCQHCASSSTPQWREGPKGSGTLCNACGVQYRQGRLLPEYRPRASPTFEPSVHANRHSQVVKLHRHQQKGKNRCRAPPQAEELQPTNDGLRVIGNNGDSAGDVQGSGGDDLTYELPLPWRWHNNNKDYPPTALHQALPLPVDSHAGGMGDSANAWCPWCAQK